MKQILTNTFWLLTEKAVTMAGNLVATIIMARYLGVETFGTLNYLMALIAIVTPLASLGINSILTRDSINAPEKTLVIYTTATFLRFGGSLLGVLLLVPVSFLLLDLSNDEINYVIILSIFSIAGAFQALEFWFQAKVNMKPVVLFRLINFVSFFICKIWLVLNAYSFSWLIFTFGAELLFLGLGYYFLFVLKCGKISYLLYDKIYARKLLKKSLWLLLSGVAAVIYIKIDQVMLAQIVSRAEVGIYSVAVRLSEVWYFFATALVSSVFPSLLKARHDSYDGYYRKLQYISDVLCWVAVVIAIFVTIFGEWFIITVFGLEYSASFLILCIHIWSAVFVFMRAVVSKWILAEDCLKFSLISHGVGAVVNIVLNLILIPLYGGIGAAMATLLSYVISGWLIFYVSARTRPIAAVIFNSITLPVLGIERYIFLLRKKK